MFMQFLQVPGLVIHEFLDFCITVLSANMFNFVTDVFVPLCVDGVGLDYIQIFEYCVITGSQPAHTPVVK